MISQKEKEEIVQLIKNGMDMNVISFELDIPKETLQQYVEEFSKPTTVKEEVKTNDENKGTKTINNIKDDTTKRNVESVVSRPKTTVSSIPKSNRPKINKMEIIRKKYKEAYNKVISLPKFESRANKYTDEDLKKADEIIKNLENKIKELKTKKFKEKRNCAAEVLDILKEFYDLPCLVEQVSKVQKLMSTQDLNSLHVASKDKIDIEIKKSRIKINRKLVDIVETEASKIDNLDDVSKLRKMITVDMERLDMSIVSVRLKLDQKINYLQQKARINSKDDVSNEIKDIVRQIINPNMDAEQVKQKIDEEAEKLLAKSPAKGFFAMKKDNYVSQVLIKIRTALTNEANEFSINDADLVLEQLLKIDSRNFSANFKAVIENFVARKDYKTARSICDKYIQKRSLDSIETETSAYARTVKKEIIGAEIGEIMLSQINNRMIDDEKFIEDLENRMKKNNVKPFSIKLGKNKDGTKTITLSDVWYENQQRK